MPAFEHHEDRGEKGIALNRMTHGEPDKEGSLRTGEKIVNLSSRSKPLSRKGRSNIAFRVVGGRRQQCHGEEQWKPSPIGYGITTLLDPPSTYRDLFLCPRRY